MAIPITQLIQMQRRQALRLNQVIVDDELAKILRDAARDARAMAREIADFPGVGAATRQAQLRFSALASEDMAAKLWHRTGEVTREGIFRAADLAALQATDLDKVIGMPLSYIRGYEEALRGSARVSAESIIARRRFGYTLSQRVYRNELLTAGRLNRVIESGLVNNLSARDLAKQVGQFIDPKTPGGASYAAMRLARTEINNAHHWVSTEQYEKRPWIDWVKWNLSGSHPRTDECDELAESGPYPSDGVPDKPHPQCLCFTTPELPDIDQFLDDLLEGDYNDWLEDNSFERIVCNSSCKVTGSDGAIYQRWDTVAEQEQWLEDYWNENEEIFFGEYEDIEEFLGIYLDDSTAYNSILRGHVPSNVSMDVISRVEFSTDELAAAISRVRTPENIITYRGMDNSAFEQITKGSRFLDRGFTSTSLNEDVARDFGEYIAEIQVPEGTQALGLPAAQATFQEQELILNKRTRFDIVEVDHIAKRVLLKVVMQHG